MDYATKNHFGKNKNARRTKTKGTAPTIGRIYRMDKTPKRHQRNTEGQTEIRSCATTTDGFLKSTFLPKLKAENRVEQDGDNSIKIEKDFYQSLSQLAEHYQIQPKPTRDFGFPYNVALALDDLRNLLKNNIKDWKEIRLIQEENKTYFTSEECYNTGSTLYYIPLLPLYRLSKNPKRRQAVQLLQSVCCYLYHIAGISYYRQRDTYLFWMYEMVSDWITSDDENEETPTYLSEIKQAEQFGDLMEKKIFNHYNLNLFEVRLKNFKAKDTFDKDCYLLASKIFELYQHYPNTTIYQNLQSNSETEEYDRDTMISMDKYVSFCAETKGMLFQTLFESINTEFQECTEMQEPSIIKKFDGRNVSNNNLDFENCLFPLIDELIYILNSF